MLPKNRAPTHPGEMLLKEFLEPKNITQKEFAKHIGWTYARLNEIINGNRSQAPPSYMDPSLIARVKVKMIEQS